jgi:MFS family permease
VRYILDESVGTFPSNYALLIGCSGLSFAVGILILSAVVEPAAPARRGQVSLGQQLRNAPAILRKDRAYATYIAARAAASGLTLATPFYVLYSAEVLRAPVAMAGIYISVRTLARVLSNMFWGKQCQRRSSLWVLKVSYALGMIPPLLSAVLAASTLVIGSGGASALAVGLFVLVFLIQGLAVSAAGIAQIAFLYDIAPESARPTYYGLSNTVLGPLQFLPALGGALLDSVGFAPVFAAAAALMGLAYVIASRIDTRDHVPQKRSSPGLAAE